MFASRKSQIVGLLSAASIAAIAGVSSLAAATAVNVQFDQPHGSVNQVYTGTAAAPDKGTFWNQINTAVTVNSGTVTGSALKASDGTTVTTIGFTLSGSDLYGAKPSFAFNNNGTGNKLLENFVVGGPFSKGDKTAETLTITGLTPGAKYNIYFYGSKNAGADSTLTIGTSAVATDGRPAKAAGRWQLSKNGEFTATNAKPASAADLFDAANEGHTWNVISGVVADNKGDIIGKIGTGSDAAYAAINGFQVVSSGH
ncbi:MAG: hypothetical protein ACP5I8_06650 [Phycisphaerae bacterium]